MKKYLLLLVFILVLISLIVYVVNLGISKKQSRLIYSDASSQQEKQSSCLILPEEYCNKGTLVKWKDQSGKSITGVGFVITENVDVFSPSKGHLAYAILDNSNKLKGTALLILNSEQDPDQKNYSLVGDILRNTTATANINKGEKIGKIKNSGIKNLDKYNLLFIIYSKNENSVTELKKIFKTLN